MQTSAMRCSAWSDSFTAETRPHRRTTKGVGYFAVVLQPKLEDEGQRTETSERRNNTRLVKRSKVRW